MGLLFGKPDEQVTSEYFDGKVVWITGASAGLGEALCLALVRAADVKGLILSARSAAELERVRAACLQLRPSVQIKVLPVDLSDLDSLPRRTAEAKEAFPRIDVLVNNAGRGFRDLAEDTALDVDRAIMDLNFFSGVALTKGLLDGWLERGCGHVVQISSVQGFFGLPGRTAYSASKHAAVGFYDSLRAEVEHRGVAVTLVAPGYIATKHSQNAARGGPDRESYPEGHTTKAMAPDAMAPLILAATARRWPELVPAALDARAAKVLRSLVPALLFKYMSRRGIKEQRETQRLSGSRADQDSLTTPLKAD